MYMHVRVYACVYTVGVKKTVTFSFTVFLTPTVCVCMCVYVLHMCTYVGIEHE